MKKSFFLSLLCLLLCATGTFAQERVPLHLELAHHKTTTLVFPSTVRSVDRGSAQVLAQVPAAAPHLLHVKAAAPGIRETNLTVLTADGRLYLFDIRYALRPAVSHLTLTPSLAVPAAVPAVASHQARLRAITAQLAEDSRFYYGIRDRKGAVKATVEGIYVQDSTLFLRLVLTNRSAIPYTLDFTRFSILDRKQTRRTARQETELFPRTSDGPAAPSLGQDRRAVYVHALDKFTIARDKVLRLELFEQQGGRYLQLRIKGKHLLSASPLHYP